MRAISVTAGGLNTEHRRRASWQRSVMLHYSCLECATWHHSSWRQLHCCPDCGLGASVQRPPLLAMPDTGASQQLNQRMKCGGKWFREREQEQAQSVRPFLKCSV